MELLTAILKLEDEIHIFDSWLYDQFIPTAIYQQKMADYRQRLADAKIATENHTNEPFVWPIKHIPENIVTQPAQP